jgi:phospholipid/cholesterol/gamma-HCH transport system permease protein
MDPTISFIGFTAGILEKFTLSEFTITLLKGLIGGGMIGLVSIYFGSKVSQKFSDLPRAISNATTSQLVMFFLINVSLSVLAYR